MIQYQNTMNQTLDKSTISNLSDLYETFDAVQFILKQATSTFNDAHQQYSSLLGTITEPHLKTKLLICLEALKKEYEVLFQRLEYYLYYYQDYLNYLVQDMGYLEDISNDMMSAKVSSKDGKNYKMILQLCMVFSYRIQEYLLKPFFDFAHEIEELDKRHEKSEAVIKSLSNINQKIVNINGQMEKNHLNFLNDWNKFLDLQPIIQKFSNDYALAHPKS